MGLGTAFKKVYGELLEPYGYKKVKGGKPYLVRVINDEIIHVITCIPVHLFGGSKTRCAITGMQDGKPYTFFINSSKEYVVCGGVATVYRKRMDFNCTPLCHNWFTHNLDICLKTTDIKRSIDLVREFTSSYPPDDEEKLMESMWASVKQTKEYLLPVLDRVTDLRSCIDYYLKFRAVDITCYFEDDFGVGTMGGKDSDWMSYVKVFTFDEFRELQQSIYNGYMEKYREKIKNNALTETDKRNIEWDNNRLNEDLTGFERWTKDPVLYKKLLDEMETRKAANTEKLRSYGLDI